MVCSITILFLEWFWLHSFSSLARSFWLLFFLFGMDDFWSGKSFSTPRYPRSNTFTTFFWGCRMILFIDVIVMPFSFLVVCFMDDDTLVVNHELSLYGMPFLLSRIMHISSFLFLGLGICCSVQSMKDRKPGNIFSTSSGVRSLFVVLCMF